MKVDVETVVIGAGAVGLAVAAVLAQAGQEVLILEAGDEFGSGTSARNSEVIHAGIYYEKNSLKARYCVSGKQLLYTYCQTRQVPVRQCGKLIVATNQDQLEQLRGIMQRAADNGVRDLSILSSDQAKELEPELECLGAVLSPSTGIVDSHSFMMSLLADAQNHQAILVCQTPVEALSIERKGGYFLVCTGGVEATTITARHVINAAGHGACDIFNSLTEHTKLVAKAVMVKGSYFSLAAKSPFSRLVYPVPEEHGLGVHLTLDLAGRARFGPDVERIKTANYAVDADRADGFYAAIRRYWPSLPDNALLPDYAGIRPRVCINDCLMTDFIVQGEAEHGLPGFVNLMGIESPGLTASLAIAEAVYSLLKNPGSAH